MKKIAILTCLSDFNPCYSIAGIVHDYINLFSKNLKNFIFITTDDFNQELPSNVELRTYKRYSGSTEDIDPVTFDRYAFETSSVLETLLKDVDICITHDIVFITGFLPINCALRQAKTKCKFYHWVHSVPCKREELEYPQNARFTPFPNSKFVYPNYTDAHKVAKMYNVPQSDVIVIPHFIDITKAFSIHPLSVELIQKLNLLSFDSICIYPTRIADGKQIDKAIKLVKAMKPFLNTQLIIANSWSNNQTEKDQMKALKEIDPSIIFTSEFKSKWCEENNYNIELGLPIQVVTDLLRISDLFILPSLSESYSLIMLEAAMNKNLVCLNEDLFYTQLIGGQKIDSHSSSNCLYYQFGSLTRPIGNYLPSEEDWYRDHARKLVDYLNNDKAISFFRKVRRENNPDFIYQNFVKSLLF